MKRVYSKRMIKLTNDTNDKYILLLKSFADIYYSGYDLIPQDKIHNFTITTMNAIRNVTGITDSMTFAKNSNGETVLFFFDNIHDGKTRTAKKDEIGVYVEVE